MIEKTPNAENDTGKQDYDTPWKKILEAYFRDFIGFYFPEMAREIDWSKGYRFLDKELRQIAKDSELGKRFADALAEIHRLDGAEQWLLTHVEIQGQRQSGFAKRMYVYNYRGFDRFDRKVISLAVLADDNPSWRPDHFSYELWGCKAGLWFPTVKLLDYRERWDELEESDNPFASVVMAHLKAAETTGDGANRYRWKLYLVKRLYRKGYRKQDVILLFEFIDWVMSMPRDLETGLWREIEKIEKEEKMEYITSVERIGIEKGMQQGMQKGMEKGVRQGRASVLQLIASQRFNASTDAVRNICEGLTSEQIETLAMRFMEAESLDDLRKWADEMRKSSPNS